VTVNPNEAKVVKYRVQPEGNGAYSYACGYGGEVELPAEILLEKAANNHKLTKKKRGNY